MCGRGPRDEGSRGVEASERTEPKGHEIGDHRPYGLSDFVTEVKDTKNIHTIAKSP